MIQARLGFNKVSTLLAAATPANEPTTSDILSGTEGVRLQIKLTQE